MLKVTHFVTYVMMGVAYSSPLWAGFDKDVVTAIVSLAYMILGALVLTEH